MKLPIMNKRGSGELLIPELFGGMNLRDAVSMVGDNQLTDCLNMWKADGVLKTRPGIKITENLITKDFESGNAATGNELKQWWGEKAKRHEIYFNYENSRLQLISVPCLQNLDTESDKYFRILFYLFGGGRIHYLPILDNISAESYFIAEKDGYIYCYLNDGKFSIYKAELSPTADTGWTAITEEERYVPIVMTHCKPLGKKNAGTDEVTGTMIEGYNLLSDYYTIIYNSFNVDLITDTKTTHLMLYHLPENISKQKYVGKTVTVKYTSGSGTVIHTVPITTRHSVNIESSRVNEKGEAVNDGIEVHIFANRVWFYSDETGKEKYISDGGIDDIEITAPYIWDAKDREKVFKMTRTEWFGGASAGLAGGTRLFLCGNDGEKNLVMWSGLNNPLYFPDNSYFYVGNSDSMVTGFGKEGNNLIIFKETETWYTQYYQNTEITAEDLVMQRIVDYTSSSVYFPLTQINPYIGCPYPDTVQLCRNRLVWLSNNKNVCSLVSNNEYSERTIFTVSEMIQRELNKYDISDAAAVDWNGHYVLSFGSGLYLMDYNCYGFTYISSYSKTEDANVRIPWYYWVLPNISAESIILSVDNMLGVCCYLPNARVLCDELAVGFADFSLYEDTVTDTEGNTEHYPISSHFTTKLFEFSAPHVRKNIDKINLQLGCNGGEPIGIEYITECGIEEDELTLYGESTQPYSPSFIESTAVFPCMRNVLRFGIKLKCSGPIAVDGIVIKYRYTSGAR